MENLSEYEIQANEFLAVTKTEFKIRFLKNGFHFDGDKEPRDIYEVELRRGSRSYKFNFGQSLNGSGFYYTKGKIKTPIDRKYLEKGYFKGKIIGLAGTIKLKDSGFLNNGKSDIIHYPEIPTPYDVLACLQKYDVGTFEDFCIGFGYDTDSIKALKTYEAVKDEFKNVQALFNDEEIELLKEIQ